MSLDVLSARRAMLEAEAEILRGVETFVAFLPEGVETSVAVLSGGVLRIDVQVAPHVAGALATTPRSPAQAGRSTVTVEQVANVAGAAGTVADPDPESEPEPKPEPKSEPKIEAPVEPARGPGPEVAAAPIPMPAPLPPPVPPIPMTTPGRIVTVPVPRAAAVHARGILDEPDPPRREMPVPRASTRMIVAQEVADRLAALDASPEPIWSPKLDLRLVEVILRGDGVDAAGAVIGMSPEAALARWKLLMPRKPSLDEQRALIDALKARAKGPSA